MRSFLRLECFALTENALGFFRIWIGLSTRCSRTFGAATADVRRRKLHRGPCDPRNECPARRGRGQSGILLTFAFVQKLARQSSQIAAGTEGAVQQRLHHIDSSELELVATGSPQRTGCEPQHQLSRAISENSVSRLIAA